MIAVFLLPPQAWVERLGWTLLHFLWQGVLIAKLFAAARGLAGRSLSPRVRYAWACAALAAMALAPVATFALIGSGSPLIPASASGWSARPFAVGGFAGRSRRVALRGSSHLGAGIAVDRSRMVVRRAGVLDSSGRRMGGGGAYALGGIGAPGVGRMATQA